MLAFMCALSLYREIYPLIGSQSPPIQVVIHGIRWTRNGLQRIGEITPRVGALSTALLAPSYDKIASLNGSKGGSAYALGQYGGVQFSLSCRKNGSDSLVASSMGKIKIYGRP